MELHIEFCFLNKAIDLTWKKYWKIFKNSSQDNWQNPGYLIYCHIIMKLLFHF